MKSSRPRSTIFLWQTSDIVCAPNFLRGIKSLSFSLAAFCLESWTLTTKIYGCQFSK